MNNEDKAWLEYRENFSAVYDDANYTSPLQRIVMRESHKLVEKAFTRADHFSRVIEIGAGTGEHAKFVRHKYDEYMLTDLDPKTLDVAKKKIGESHAGRVSFEVHTGERLAYPDGAFDRLIATHVLEHIYRPHLAIKEWRRVIRQGGVLSIVIPTDPGVAWRFGRYLGPRKKAVAQGVAYDYVMAREHVNSCNNLIAILRHYFPEAKESWWPFPIALLDINLFFAFHAIVDKQEDVG